MFEIQEAAKLITESIDPDAKVIFGAINDDHLKKNEIKVTVIACGFPENLKRRIGGGIETETTESDKREIKTKEKSRNPFDVDPVRAERPEEKEEEDDWSSIPAFLRRSNKGK